MKSLIIKLKVKDNVEAYQIVSRLGFKFKIDEVIFEKKTYKFSETKKPKHFLRDDFGKTNE